MKNRLIRWGRTAGLAAAMLMMAVTARAAEVDLPEGWTTSWDDARAQAKETGKPILAVFSAEWCGPCQQMRKNVYPLDAVKQQLQEWVPVYVDTDEHPELAKQYDISSIPAFVFLSPDLKVEGGFIGARPAAAFQQILSDHKEQVKQIESLQEKLGQEPESPQLWKELAELRERREEYDQAIQAYEKVAYYDPKDELGTADQLYFLKSVPQSDKDLEASAEKLAKFEEQFPESELLPEVYLNRAYAALYLSDPDKAAELLREGVERFPGTPQAAEMQSVLDSVTESRQ